MKHIVLIVGGLMLGVASVTYAAGDAAAGKAKAAACAACHGANGEGKTQGNASYPPLAGKSEADIVQALQDYKSGKRANAIMKGSVSKLSDADMANLGAYYASLKP